jgi:hypothetical protein
MDFEKNFTDTFVKEQSSYLSENYLDSFLQCILAVEYVSSNVLGISYRTGKYVVRDKTHNYLYYIDELSKKITMIGFKSGDSIPGESTIKRAFESFSLLQRNVFVDFKEEVYVSEYEIYETKRLFQLVGTLPCKTEINNITEILKIINNKLDNVLIGEKLYDIRKLDFCEPHYKIFKFDSIYPRICGRYEKCIACEWISSRELPFYKCLLEGKKDHNITFSKQDLQSMILYFDNIDTEVPNVIFDIANLIFYS